MTKRRGFMRLIGVPIFVVAAILANSAAAQGISIDLDDSAGLTERAIQLIALITVLSLAPSILVMVTSFTRIVVVLSLLRTALGTQQAPPNSVIIGLSLFLTLFVMAPVFEKAYSDGIQPLVAEEIELTDAFERASQPFHTFMMSQVRAKDLDLFLRLGGEESLEESGIEADQVPMRSLVPAFMISELRRAFEIGFLLFIPFIVIDLVVASVLMSMGMMMLPPILISLPFKLVFFVLVDGWHMVVGSLVESYGT